MTATRLTASQQTQLERDGYVVFRHVLSPEQVAELIARLEALWAEEGARAGAENYIEQNARRLANLVNKGDSFRPVFRHPLILAAALAVLGPAIRLSMLNARDVPPYLDPKMPYHCDTDRGGKPDEKGYNACTATWMLDDFTGQNGATHLVPGTHRANKLPKEVLVDVYGPHPDEAIIEGTAGDVLVFNGHCWHKGGPNTTAYPRRAILAHYVRAGTERRLKPKEHLSPEVQNPMTPLEREILGLDD